MKKNQQEMMAFSKAHPSPTTKQTFVNITATSNNNNNTSKNINKNHNNNNNSSSNNNNNNTTLNKKFNPKYFNPLSCLQCSPGGGGGGDRATICSLLLSEDEVLPSSVGGGVGGVMGLSNAGGGANSTSWAENVITSLMNVASTNDVSSGSNDVAAGVISGGGGQFDESALSPSLQRSQQPAYANHAGTYPRVTANQQLQHTQQQQQQQQFHTSSTLQPTRPQSTTTTGKGGVLAPSRVHLGVGGVGEEEDYEEPLYDSVASDEDSNADRASFGAKTNEERRRSAVSRNQISAKLADNNDNLNTDDPTKASVPVEKYLALKEALTLSDSRVQQLLLSNRDLKQEIALLQNMVRKLMHENLSLRKMKGMDVPPQTVPLVNDGEQYDDYAHIESQPEEGSSLLKPSPVEPASPNSSSANNKNSPSAAASDSAAAAAASVSNAISPSISPSRRSSPPSTTGPAAELVELGKTTTTTTTTTTAMTVVSPTGAESDRNEVDDDDDDDDGGGRAVSTGGASDYDNASPTRAAVAAAAAADGAPQAPTTTTTSTAEASPEVIRRESQEYLPREEDVVRKTEKITRKIQELLLAAQDGRESCYGPCAEKIYAAVRDMAALFPERPNSSAICEALHALTGSAARLQVQCHDHALASANLCLDAKLEAGSDDVTKAASSASALMTSSLTSSATSAPYTQAVIQCAYEIAKAAKKLVTEFQ